MAPEGTGVLGPQFGGKTSTGSPAADSSPTRLTPTLQQRLKNNTPEVSSCCAVLNHTEQRVGDPLTQALAPGKDFPLGRYLLHPPRLSEQRALPGGPLGSKLAQGSGLCWEGSGAGLPCCSGSTQCISLGVDL